MHAPSLTRNQSLQRAVGLLRELARRPAGASGSELARALQLPRATVGRLLATLADVGLVERTPAGDAWLLGPEAVRLGRAATPFAALVVEAQPMLERLAAEVGESTMLGVTRWDEVEVIAQADAASLVGVTRWVGRPLTGLHASAGGKVFLSQLTDAERGRWLAEHPLQRYTEATITTAAALDGELRRVREEAHAESVDELETGLASLAVPVTPAGAYPSLSIGLSGPSFRLDAERLRDHLGPVRRAADQLRRKITN